MTTDVPSWWTNNHTKRTTGSHACLPDLETTRPENLPPKEKSDSADAEKANRRIIPVHSIDQALSSLDQAHSAHWFFLEKTYTYKKDGEGAKNQLKYNRISALPVHWPSWSFFQFSRATVFWGLFFDNFCRSRFHGRI